MSCCDKKIVSDSISKKLDEEDLEGAIHVMEGRCATSIEDIEVTKFLLIYRLGMLSDDSRKSKELKKKAIDGLSIEERNGSRAATSLMREYRKSGDAYFASFPWGDIIGRGRFPTEAQRAY